MYFMRNKAVEMKRKLMEQKIVLIEGKHTFQEHKREVLDFDWSTHGS